MKRISAGKNKRAKISVPKARKSAVRKRTTKKAAAGPKPKKASAENPFFPSGKTKKEKPPASGIRSPKLK